MKTKLFLGLSIALLAMGCTSETEMNNENTTKITRIYVGAENVIDTRTETDAETAAVTWTEGDEIAVFHVNGSGRSDYKYFVLESGDGETKGYFKGADPEVDYLIPGETYKVVYPYWAVVDFDGGDNIHEMSIALSNNSTDHLADYNWLASTAKTIPTNGTMPAFSMAQQMSLVKLRVDIENFTVTGTSNRRYFGNINFTTTDTAPVFYSFVYWNNNLEVAAGEMSEVLGCGFNGNIQIQNNTSYYFWVPVKQDTSKGVKEIDIALLWRNSGGGTTTTAHAIYTPKSAFAPGYIYNVHLKLSFTAGSANSATLTVVQ